MTGYRQPRIATRTLTAGAHARMQATIWPAVEQAMAESDGLSHQVTAVMAPPDFPVGPVDETRIQRTAEAMLQFGLLGKQYATEVQQGTLVRSMIAP
jgi:hypothetical protein